MAANGASAHNGNFPMPEVHAEDIQSFHHGHFSQTALQHFGATFAQPDPEEAAAYAAHDDWAEEDDLGYYDDGVKRTLTDEQIAIFRHSELERLRKEQEDPSRKWRRSGNSLESSNNRVKKRKKKGGKGRNGEPKPDLRKRTWDVVEPGLDTLDYD